MHFKYAVQEKIKCKTGAKANASIYLEFLIPKGCEELANKGILILKSFHLTVLFLIIIHETVNGKSYSAEGEGFEIEYNFI